MTQRITRKALIKKLGSIVDDVNGVRWQDHHLNSCGKLCYERESDLFVVVHYITYTPPVAGAFPRTVKSETCLMDGDILDLREGKRLQLRTYKVSLK